MRGRALALGGCIIAASFPLFAGGANAQPASITVSPSTFSFGTLCVGGTSSTQFTISNQGNAPVDLSIDRRTGSAAFTNTVPKPSSIDPGGSATFLIRFAPSSSGSPSATFRVTATDQNNSSTADVHVSGTGIDRRLSADRSSVSFGNQRVGARSPAQKLTIRNAGADAVTVSSVARVGTNAADFRVFAPATPFSIGAGAATTLSVAFQPTAAGLRSGAVELASNACSSAKLRVALVGTGVVPNVVVDPNPINVGASPIAVESRPTAVTVSNDGKAPLKITAIQVLGTDAADFALTGLPVMPVTVQPAGTFVFSVRMTPSAGGSRTASINVVSDDPDAPALSVVLVGTAGTPTPSPSASTSALPSHSPSASPSSSTQALAQSSNDSLALGLVIGGVLAAFAGLIVIRRIVASPDED